jgi:hypothetical protein
MLKLLHLDERTRRLMLDEIEHDVRQGTLYVSPRLSNTGQQNYLTLLTQAVTEHDDTWLAEQLSSHKRMRDTEQKKKPTGGYTVSRVPGTAAETLAEGEFNRYYTRAVCRRALEDGLPAVVVYRAKGAEQPRDEAEERVDTLLDPASLLEDLRTHPGMETVLGLPRGPNSGLSVRLPNATPVGERPS